MGEVFTRRVHQMDEKDKQTLGAAIRGSPDPVTVRSTFDMPVVERAAIQNALNETFASDVRIRYETDTGTLCGIELSANGQKVGWSIADYVGPSTAGSAQSSMLIPASSRDRLHCEMSALPGLLGPSLDRGLQGPAQRPRGLQAGADATRGGHGLKHLDRHSQGLGPSRRGLGGADQVPRRIARDRLQRRRRMRSA
jgi:hypothetical protein